MTPRRVAVFLETAEGCVIALMDGDGPGAKLIDRDHLHRALETDTPTILATRPETPSFEPLPAPHVSAKVSTAALIPDAAALAEEDQSLTETEAMAVTVAAALYGLLTAGALDANIQDGSVDLTGIDPLRLRQALPRKRVPPRLRNDCFAMPQGVDWVPVDDALARLKAALHPVTGTETRKTAQVSGAVLAADAIAMRSNPPAANSAVDGYGFAASSLIGSGPYRLPLLVGRAAAGQPFESIVAEGSAVRILTGAILPEGVDTVVLEEDTAVDGAAVVFDGPIRAGANTRAAGEDVGAGAVALCAGQRLRPPDIALLTALGVAEVTTHRPLRVGVLSTGDEIIRGLEHPAAPHQIWDANGPMLLAMIEHWKHHPVDLGHVGDDADTIASTFDQASRDVDVILTSGGASAGDEDHVSKLLRDQGDLSSWRIALKPGRPLALALWNGIPVFGLPGNPVAAFVCALIFARPALSCLSGGGWMEPLGFEVPADFSKRKKPGRREYLRARLNQDGWAEVFHSEGSGRISGLSWADGLVELPDGEMTISPGDPVRYLPYSSFGLS